MNKMCSSKFVPDVEIQTTKIEEDSKKQKKCNKIKN